MKINNRKIIVFMLSLIMLFSIIPTFNTTGNKLKKEMKNKDFKVETPQRFIVEGFEDCVECLEEDMPIMHPDEETYKEWLDYYESITDETTSLYYDLNVNPMMRATAGPDDDHFDLLNHIWYDPFHRNQGSCGNCWAWASTGCMEIALHVQEGIKDRLSVQFLNSNKWDGNLSGQGGFACCGGSTGAFKDFYKFNKTFAIPWNNTNGDHIDDNAVCEYGHTNMDPALIEEYPYYNINSISDHGIATYEVGQATAISRIKTKLLENKGLYYWFALPNASSWDDGPNGFKYFWGHNNEDVIWNLDWTNGSTWEDSGGSHGVLCVGWDQSDPSNPYWIMVNSWSTAGGLRPNGIFHLDMNTDYNTFHWKPDYSERWQAQGFVYFSIGFDISANDPVADANGPYTEPEGTTVSFDASGSSDADGNPLKFRWDLDNDGSWDTSWSSSSGCVDTWYDDYADDVVVQVCDGSRLDIDTASVTITNVAPTVVAGSDQTADEGDLLFFSGSFTDPGADDTHSYVWDFGDGNTEYGSTFEPNLNPTHSYCDNGLYTATLTVTDDDGGIGSDTFTVTVYNVPPIADAGPDQIVNENDTVTFDGDIVDPGGCDTFTIDWYFGDGYEILNSGTLTPTHIYGDNGVFTVTLTVTDDDGESDSDTMTVTVNNVAPEFDSYEITKPYEGNPDFILPLVHNLEFTAEASDNGSDDLTFTWDWENDGTPDSVVIYYNDGVGPDPYPSPEVNPMFAVDAQYHTFGEPGTYDIEITVDDDDDGGSCSYLTSIKVLNATEAKHDINDYIQALDNGLFKPKAEKRKQAFDNMFNALDNMFVDGDYWEMITHLQENIREKCDGSLGGNPKNDWILDDPYIVGDPGEIAQYHICNKIDDLCEYIYQYYLA